MNLQDIRVEIDRIDEEIIALFQKRMECSRQVAEYKLANSIPIFNPEREAVVLDRVEERAGTYGSSARQLYATMMELSRALQHDLLGSGSELKNRIGSAETKVPYDSSDLKIACFGVSGTYANRAANIVFPHADPSFCPSFHEVFEAVLDGEADFGVVPIENSSAGSVTDVYDLMLQYRFSIAAAVDIPINHCLAVRKGVKLENLTTVYSHQQALSQCSHFLTAHHLRKQAYLSTAAAAKMVAESEDRSIAAICSERAAEEYGLDILLQGFQDNPNNKTRFIIISKKLYIEENADKISLCFSLPHVTGSLYSTLCRFAADGLNLTKLESRPVAGTDFEYLFYLDFTGSVRTPKTLALLCALSDELTEFSFLGNYIEK